jgi:hypothetical protein
MSANQQFDDVLPPSQTSTTPVRAWAVAILLLDHGLAPREITFQGPVPIFWYPRVEASVVLARYARLKEKLHDMVDVARTEVRQ